MNTQKRRESILKILKESGTSITASSFSEKFGVTRQIIVNDIAILRANGHNIIATKNGYSLPHRSKNRIIESIACKHKDSEATDEFYAIVDNGGAVIDVIVEHPLYGQISAYLNIRSRFDADEFSKRATA